MADIAVELGVTESRVSQMRAEALKLLKDGMNSQLEPSVAAPVSDGRGAAQRGAYYAAIAGRSTMRDRLAHTTVTGTMTTVVGRRAAA